MLPENLMMRFLAATAVLALVPTVHAQSVTITAASRSVETLAFGYDWDFNNGEQDVAQSTATSGVFDDLVFVDLDEWYGGHVGTGTGTIDSNLSPTAIEASFDLYASCLNTGVYQADCSSVGLLDVDFTATTRVRAKVSFEAFCYDDYSWALASLHKVGASGSILSLQVFGNDDGGLGTTTWLQVGDYQVDGEANCGAFGTYGTSDDSTCVLNASVLLYHEADYNADGHVNTADRTAFLAAYNAGSLAADFDGNGLLKKADKTQFLASWNAAKE